MRVVLDTNILLSALFIRGFCATVLDALIESEVWGIVLSEYILDEFCEHATSKFSAPFTEVNQAVSFLRRHAEIVEPVSLSQSNCPDPDDIPILGTAIAGRVAALVTGDRALLNMKVVDGIPILSPRAFYDQVIRQSPPG